MNNYNNTLPTQRVKSIYNDKNNKFFLVKSYSDKNIQISQVYNVWATTPKNENKFVEAFTNNSYVILIFSVNGSSKFCGYAIMESRPGESKNKNVYFYYDQKIFRGKNFDIQWIRIVDLPFSQVQNITNSLNENKSIKVGRDGQEIERTAGVKLCEIFELHLGNRNKMNVDIPFNISVNNINRNNNHNNSNNNNNTTTTSTNSTSAFAANNNNFVYNVNRNNQMPMVHPPNPQEMYHCGTNFMLNNVNRYTDVANVYNSNNSFNMDWNNFRNLYDSQHIFYTMYNPALCIFPIDVSNMSYDEYISYYENSQALWRMKMLQNEIKY